MTLLGEIVEHDGMICLKHPSTPCWWPLMGNSGIADQFRQDFGQPVVSDIGRQLHMVGGVIQMESLEQAKTRKDKLP